ncbi:MAG: Uncharacterized protein LiPW39_145 [Parcubacteria group bacterium LiPW_39]|nr:MAG: Uncharacterized protein LiPW39_145 [Parcubacteria group bacterium LiPW_39]
MKHKTIVIFVLGALIFGAGTFYGGMKYQQSKGPTAADFSARGGSAVGGQNLRNLSSEERQQMFGQMGTNASGAAAGRRADGANAAAGEIIAKDDKSITVKLSDGGSKIIFFSDSAKVTKSTAGTIADLGIGETVFASGTQNSDGSLTAETLQLGTITPINR